jgi:long-chain fatty acid transport protein
MFGVRERTVSLLTTAAAVALQQAAVGEGFRNPPPGAFSLARAGGRRAQIDTADAAYHNPANVVDIPQITLEASPTFVYIKTEHQNQATGQSAETTDPFKVLPNFFATFPILDNKLAAGLAVTTPFGLSNEWDKEGAFAPGGAYRNATAWYTELMTVDVGPSISWRINDRISFGAGLDVYWSQITLKQFFPAIPPFGLPENPVRARGDGMAVGGNAGLTINLTDNQRLAFTYRSPFTVDYDGNVKFDNPPLVPGTAQESDFSSRIQFPTVVGVGYGIKLSDTVRVEADGEWLQFSNFDQLPLHTGANKLLEQSVAQNWKDTFTVGIAGDWRFHDNWTLRGGYQFYETPVPDSTFSPTIPDANQNAFTFGIDFHSGHHEAEFAYGYIRYDDRDINNGPAYPFNGHYETTVHLFALAYSFRF